ncbi:MAG: CpsD/CapB family tyrosine-protein kinase [Candidatus Omnitrophica bacterium]|nr:CpsD/CapB family tyrosine-protein kinase [Candidatus Omnitrophota bacterium]
MNLGNELIVAVEPDSLASESFRTLKVNLQFAGVDRNLKAILITSADSKSGRSTLAANLGLAIAQSNKKVLLIDADMRSPSLHRFFQMGNTFGLSSAIVEIDKDAANRWQFIKNTPQQNLYLMTSGTLPPNPPELLASERMKVLLERLKSDFDYIIFDSPPLLPVTDAAVLARICDGTILVIRSGRSFIDAVRRSKVMLSNLKANLLGAVLNDFNIKEEHYYYYDYKYKKQRGGR